jgi:site-specific recombinase XerD
MRPLVQQYISDHKLAWQPSTLRSEQHRLNGVVEELDGNPERLWNALEAKGMKAYSRKTTFTRVVKFWDWLIGEGVKDGPNPYKDWRKKHGRLFKHSYQPQVTGCDYQEAIQRINQIDSDRVREHASELLQSGLRFAESYARSGDRVVGKGGKMRKVYGSPSTLSRVSYGQLRRELSKLGLKPHDLRKIFLNEMVRRGAQPHELKELAGWSSIVTADSYIKARSSRLEELVNGSE